MEKQYTPNCPLIVGIVQDSLQKGLKTVQYLVTEVYIVYNITVLKDK